MKKKNTISYIVIFSLSLILALSLAGCGKSKEKADTNETDVEANSDTDKNDSESENTDENSDNESEITEEDFNTFTEFNDNLVDIEESKYLNEDGYVDEDNIAPLLDEVEKTVEQGVSDGVIDHYTRDDDNIFIVYESGITNLFIPSQEDTFSGESKNTATSYISKPAIGGEIITIEPTKDDWDVAINYGLTSFANKKNIKEEELHPKASANLIINAEPSKYKYDSSLTNADVTVDSVKNIGDYNIVIWEGHGVYNTELHSALVTGEDASLWDRWEMGSAYINDMKEGRVTTTKHLRFAITSKFIDEYIGDMKGALLFLGVCSSMKDNELAEAFINKGAYVVFGYTDDVDKSYEILARTIIFQELTTKKENNEYQTVNEAYQNTLKKVGTDDDGCFLTGLFADNLEERYTIGGILPENKTQDTQEETNTSTVNNSEELTKEWKEAYTNYVKEHGNLTDSFGDGLDIYALVDINGDSIPELYGNLGTTANGDFVATYSKENGLAVQTLWNYGFSYIPKQNLFHDSYGHMDEYEDRVYSIENGQIVLKHTGAYGSSEVPIQTDADGMPVYNYTWDGQDVSQEEYTQKLNEVYNMDEAIDLFDGAEYVNSRYVGNGLCSYQEILDTIAGY